MLTFLDVFFLGGGGGLTQSQTFETNTFSKSVQCLPTFSWDLVVPGICVCVKGNVAVKSAADRYYAQGDHITYAICRLSSIISNHCSPLGQNIFHHIAPTCLTSEIFQPNKKTCKADAIYFCGWVAVCPSGWRTGAVRFSVRGRPSHSVTNIFQYLNI